MFDFMKKNKSVVIKSPFSGKVIKTEDIPDKVFAQEMVGKGAAINPENDLVKSPIKGEIVQIASKKHAIGIESEEGIELLIHLGIDSVELEGEGFETFVEVGEKVNVGDDLLKVDWEKIKDKITSTITPIVITNKEIVKEIKLTENKKVKTGDDFFEVILKDK